MIGTVPDLSVNLKRSFVAVQILLRVRASGPVLLQWRLQAVQMRRTVFMEEEIMKAKKMFVELLLIITF